MSARVGGAFSKVPSNSLSLDQFQPISGQLHVCTARSAEALMAGVPVLCLALKTPTAPPLIAAVGKMKKIFRFG